MKKMTVAMALVIALPALAAEMCTLISESVSGAYKTCVYQCPGGEKSVTISASQPCKSMF